MKKSAFTFLILLLVFAASAQTLKPYINGFESSDPIESIKAKLLADLEASGITVLGQYQPAQDQRRWIMIFTAPELVAAVQEVGGLTGFASTLRIGITRQNNVSKVSYTNPKYWGNAYFRSEFDKVATNYSAVAGKLVNAMELCGEYIGTEFGAEEGLEAKDLRKYHYMMGMPYFDDTKELEEFESYNDAVAKIESSVKKGVPNVKLVYKHEIPDTELTLYGFALSGEDGEEKFLPTIDIGEQKHTAFLPYEILVMGNEVHMLHGRFRIAIAFPDLTMGTFSKIMSTPGNIEDLLSQLVQ